MGMIYTPPSIIPNGALINNVCHIYQTTKPTARPDGSALMVGDRWYDTNTGVEAFWNGVYWLGTLLSISIFAANSFSQSLGTFSPSRGYFLERVAVRGYLGNRNATNFYTYSIQLRNGFDTGEIILWRISKTSLEISSAYEWGFFEATPNIAFFPKPIPPSNMSQTDAVCAIDCSAVPTGSPGFQQCAFDVFYRMIY